MEEGLPAVAVRGCGGGLFLPRVELERTEDGVGQFEGCGEVALHATVERIAENRVGVGSGLVPEQASGRGECVAGGGATDLGGPEIDFASATGLWEVEKAP